MVKGTGADLRLSNDVLVLQLAERFFFHAGEHPCNDSHPGIVQPEIHQWSLSHQIITNVIYLLGYNLPHFWQQVLDFA